MTPEERINAAINLQVPDRVPVAPLIDVFAAKYAGISINEFISKPERHFKAIEKTFLDLGPWDMQYIESCIDSDSLAIAFPLKIKIPEGEEAKTIPYQFIEEEMMDEGDYDYIVKNCFRSPVLTYSLFLLDYIPRIRPEFNNGFLNKIGYQIKLCIKMLQVTKEMKRESAMWLERGVVPAYGAMITVMPFDWFWMARSVNKFPIDMHRQKEKVLMAEDIFIEALIFISKMMVKRTGVKRVFIGAARSSSSFISPKQFETFVFPYLKKAVEEFASEDIVSLLHFDGDWTPFLHYFKELPEKSCILELDGVTDIFKAKEILGDHMCIMGDVPALLLANGTVQEVEDYCKKLIDVVGDGGGFILSSGCSVPFDAKPENIETMISCAHKYGLY